METQDREIDFKRVAKCVSDHMSDLKYDNGDLSDIGNEIGFSIGQSLKNMSQDEIDDFISGFKHGVSLTNGTH
jgi:2-keto-4-pentenoate hydratase/2-oxohepta-3-ene-1,7-dioic acid hydratase in catechol pathway